MRRRRELQPAREGITYSVRTCQWVTTTPWFIPARLGEQLYWFHIPSGFTLDLASIPRFLWWKRGFAPFELSIEAPILHDWLYQKRGQLTSEEVERGPMRFKRRDADSMFLHLMTVEGVGKARRTIAWLAVRLFGWIAWRRRRYE